MLLIPEIDKRLEKWPLMENPTKTASIVLAYLLFVKTIGPVWMKNRKPYHLRLPMILYNFFMVILSAWMFYKFGKHGWFYKYSWKCQPIDYSEDADAMAMVEVCWYFFVSKFIQLVDTIFFVLRKKNAQISAFHVIHHATVPLTARLTISRGAAGYNIFFGFVNTFVHIWMYLYYALAALGPSTHKYLWWKKYLAILEMIQFCTVSIFMIAHSLNPKCNVNMILIILSLGQAVFFLVLFLQFYFTNYNKKPKTDLSHRNGSTTDQTVTPIKEGNISDLRHRSHIEMENGKTV